ncbi:bifunctional aldehyde dehydrogenase/enoyl-CoA hydratase [Methyloligella halotolerans]|uniref:Bifunctional aldehyde dehydrogenase/enoyl-CoA hydratase n=1 Tax=Methyloligella halotolerans TaxID=1177755 RepID=A0A1E2RZD1_9HYPH|nr:MaoC family dehydratase [Methyloligella halotolerans]ODA67419.1 bifunctional aldehyde dehydrogenase/enoyl-CoA hydratase [Methyloligella halotolerans]
MSGDESKVGEKGQHSQGSPKATDFYLEDLSVGQTFRTGEHRMEADEIKRFAQQFDPQVFHTDETGAAESFFGELVASGWHTGSVTMRLLVESRWLADGFIGSRIDVTWPQAVKPGDRLHAEGVIVDIENSKSRPERGRVTVDVRTLNQRDEVVQRMTTTLLVHRRPAR